MPKPLDTYELLEFEKNDRVGGFLTQRWGNDFIVSDGKKLYGNDLPGIMILEAGAIVGLLTYHVIGMECEIVTLDATVPHAGIGTKLIATIVTKAKLAHFTRLWLMTTNDNLDAIRFYQKRGFVLTAVHSDAIKLSRDLGQDIPQIGDYGIPIRDEIELDYPL